MGPWIFDWQLCMEVNFVSILGDVVRNVLVYGSFRVFGVTTAGTRGEWGAGV